MYQIGASIIGLIEPQFGPMVPYVAGFFLNKIILHNFVKQNLCHKHQYSFRQTRREILVTKPNGSDFLEGSTDYTFDLLT